MSLVFLILLVLSPSALACGGGCSLSPGQSKLISSPFYPDSYAYPQPYQCNWNFNATKPTNFTVKCSYFNVYESQNCNVDYFECPRSDLTKARYCGYGDLTHSFFGSVFSVNFNSGVQYKSLKHYYYPTLNYGFNCTVTANPSPAPVSPSPAPTTPSSVISSSVGPNSTVAGSPKCECGKTNSESRIVGGKVTSKNEYPYQCMLTTSSGQQFCGCSLICQKYILTAAHCTDGQTASNIKVVLGDQKKNTAGDTDYTTSVDVQQIIQHASYNKGTVDNDISLLELKQPVNYNYGVSPVCLPFGMESTDISGKTGTVTGWGTTSSGGASSNDLKEVSMPLLTSTQCSKYYGASITNNMICTYLPGSDSCQGDSGGPLVMPNSDGRMVQMGAVSWGAGCAEEGRPGVYTKLTNYLPWIQSKVNPNSCSFCKP